MSNVCRLLIIVFPFVFLACDSCKRTHEDPKKQFRSESEIQQGARNLLRSRLTFDEPKSNVIASFGAPRSQYEAANHELRLYYYFADNDMEAITNGLGGFVGFFNNDLLTRYEPIYIVTVSSKQR
jgi:hypothetical protein